MNPFDPMESLATLRHEFGEHGGVNMSIEASTTFSVMNANTLPAIFQGRTGPEGGCYLYGRHFNPTVHTLGKQLAEIENAEAGYCTASGMGAISATLLQLCQSGDHIVSSHTVYGGTFALLHDFLPQKAGIKTSFVNTGNLADVEAAFTPRTKVLYVETMSNPTLDVADIPALVKIAHKRGAQVVVDNTFAPLMVTPLRWGADIVVHSLTKFINGASDIIGGAILGKTDFIRSLMDLHVGTLMLLGPTMDPHAAAAISFRLPHLGLRVTEHSRRARIFAERMAEEGLDVTYPGLKSHRSFSILERIKNPGYGEGGLLGLNLGSAERANRFIEILQNQHKFGIIAVSLGFSETLMTCPASTTSSEMTDEALLKAGIQPGLVRFSIGYSGSVEQRWKQMKNALRDLGR